MENYVHGYSDFETRRLYDQASSVMELLHHDTAYPAGSRVLEAGCGVGAQTITLARRSPHAHFVSVDISEESLAQARALIEKEGLSNVSFRKENLFALPFSAGSFDHVFVCYVLEHLAEPHRALSSLREVLKPQGTVTVIEGDHGSCYFHPETEEALLAWNCLIRVQARLGGDSLIGRRLFPLLEKSGFGNIRVSPRMVYADRSTPWSMERFVKKTIIPMVEGVKDKALEMGFTDRKTWDKGIADLHAIEESEDGTFCYTFFKAVGAT